MTKEDDGGMGHRGQSRGGDQSWGSSGADFGGGRVAPGKRTATQGQPADPTRALLGRLDGVRGALDGIGAHYLPAMQAAVASREMHEARRAGRELAASLTRIDSELAALRRQAMVMGSEGALALLAPLEAERDARRAEAAPVLALTPPAAAPLPEASAFAPHLFLDEAAEHDAANARDRDAWNAQLDASENSGPAAEDAEVAAVETASSATSDNVIDASDRFGRARTEPAKPEASAAVQRRAAGYACDDIDLPSVAAAGVAGGGGPLPHRDDIQRSFGAAHDVSGISAHVGGAAAQAAGAIGAEAYATGDRVAFAESPSLFVAAHEAAHVVQQRAGVSLLGGVGVAGDSYEQHADAVAERVVAGRSAADLLDATRGAPAACGTGTPAIQRLAARDISAEHLGNLRVFNQSTVPPMMRGVGPYFGPVPGVELFSGFAWADLTYDATLTADVLKMMEDSKPQGVDQDSGGLPAGTVASATRGKFENDHPEIAKTAGISWSVGPSSGAVKETRDTSEFVDVVAGGQVPVAASGIHYQRGAQTDPWSAWLMPGPYVRITPKELVIEGERLLQTKADGQLLANLSAKVLPDPWNDLMLNEQQVNEFIMVFEAHGATDLVKQTWYAWARTGLLDGNAPNGWGWFDDGPKDWIRKTLDRPAMHAACVRSLQHLHQAGIASAKKDLDAYVGALRRLIDDPEIEPAAKTALQELLVKSQLWSELEVKKEAFPDAPTDTPDAAETDYDLVRLSGKLLARSQLIPRLQMSRIDPVKFLEKHSTAAEGEAPVSELMKQLALEANGLGHAVTAFFDGITPEALGPAQPDAAVTPQNQLAIEAARMGAAEELWRAATATAEDDTALSMHLGVYRGLSLMLAKAGDVTAPAGYLASLAQATTALRNIVTADGARIGERGERLTDSKGKDKDRKKALGGALKDLGDKIVAHATLEAVASLEGMVVTVAVSLVKGGTIRDIQSYLGNQAAIAKTNVLLAFETAWVRYLDELKTNLRGKINAKRGGSPWTATTLLSLKTSKEILGLVKESKQVLSLAGAGKTLRLAGPTVAVVAVAIEAVTFFHNWYVKNELKSLEKVLLADADQQMKTFRDGVIAKIDAAAGAEHAHYAKAQVRDADGFDGYLTSLANGQAATPGRLVDLTSLDSSVLESFYDAAIGAQPIAFGEIVAAQTEAVAINAHQLWEGYEQQMDGVDDTW